MSCVLLFTSASRFSRSELGSFTTIEVNNRGKRGSFRNTRFHLTEPLVFNQSSNGDNERKPVSSLSKRSRMRTFCCTSFQSVELTAMLLDDVDEEEGDSTSSNVACSLFRSLDIALNFSDSFLIPIAS
jgi:hypothetical protein